MDAQWRTSSCSSSISGEFILLFLPNWVSGLIGKLVKHRTTKASQVFLPYHSDPWS